MEIFHLDLVQLRDHDTTRNAANVFYNKHFKPAIGAIGPQNAKAIPWFRYEISDILAGLCSKYTKLILGGGSKLTTIQSGVDKRMEVMLRWAIGTTLRPLSHLMTFPQDFVLRLRAWKQIFGFQIAICDEKECLRPIDSLQIHLKTNPRAIQMLLSSRTQQQDQQFTGSERYSNDFGQ